MVDGGEYPAAFLAVTEMLTAEKETKIVCFFDLMRRSLILQGHPREDCVSLML